jgi:hypothetical protein
MGTVTCNGHAINLITSDKGMRFVHLLAVPCWYSGCPEGRHQGLDFGYLSQHNHFLRQSTSVMTDFGYNGSLFHSPAVSLCFIIVTTSVTPVSYISDLRSYRISPTFHNS